MKQHFKRIALLIDADNAQPEKLETIVMPELHKLGEPVLCRAFGNWRQANKGWKQSCKRHQIERRHLTTLAQGKNGADMALTIDAMLLQQEGACDSIAIMSSDSDFTPLARQLRKMNPPMRVIIFGEDKTPRSLRRSCDKFFNVCSPVPHAPKAPAKPAAPKAKAKPAEPAEDSQAEAARNTRLILSWLADKILARGEGASILAAEASAVLQKLFGRRRYLEFVPHGLYRLCLAPEHSHRFVLEMHSQLIRISLTPEGVRQARSSPLSLNS